MRSSLFIKNCAVAIIALFIPSALALSIPTPTPPTDKKIALVTGSNKGIGKEIVRLLTNKDSSDFTVILACRSPDLGNEAIDELTADGCTDIQCIELDLTNNDHFQAVYDHVEQNYGKLDVLINNAAICFNDPTLYGKVDYTPFENQADITVKTNFFGTLGLTTTLMPLLRKSTSPRVINIVSSAGRLAILKSKEKMEQFTSETLTIQQLKDLMHQFIKAVESGNHADAGWPKTCYGMSKLGIIAMTNIFARQETKMMFNNVDPGYCATDQNKNQGIRPAQRGAVTPFLLATLPHDQFFTGLYWFDEQTIEW